MNDIICPICGFSFGNLTTHIKTHGFTTETFRLEYPNFGYLKSQSMRHQQSSFMNSKNPMSGKNHSSDSISKISLNRSGKGINVSGKYERTIEIRNKISKGVAQAHLDGRLFVKGKGSRLYSEKNKKWMWLDSSYEVRVFNILESYSFFTSFQREPFMIPYEWEGKVKHYIPDFLVTTIGGVKELWEIKPTFQMQYPITIRKQEILNEYVSTHHMNGCWLNEYTIKSFEQLDRKRFDL